MSGKLLDQVGAALGAFSGVTRLYELKLEDDGAQEAGELLVEAFACDEQLKMPGARDVIVLSTSAQLPLAPLLGKLAAPASAGMSARWPCWVAMAAWHATGCG
jgi:hypothetical protein